MSLNVIERILVVDSDRDTTELVAGALEEKGFHVQTARDGGSAQVSIMRDTPDLVVLGSDLTKESGADFCRRTKGTYPDLPVVMIVPGASEEGLQEATAAGADACLSKPVRTPQLTTLIHDIARQRKRSPAPAPADRIHFACPKCAKKMRARLSQRGRWITCAGCGAPIQIPMSGSE